MTDNFQSWSLIIFAYNEESAIKPVIEKTLEILRQLAPIDRELVIVDDCSIDNTLEIINEYANRNPEIVTVHHQMNMGIGGALLTGYSKAKFQNVCAIPADGQFNVEELLPFAIIPENSIVLFHRKKKIDYSFYRKILSYANRSFNYCFLGINVKDVNWVKIYKKEILNKITKVLTSSLVESEICSKVCLNGYSIIESESVCQVRLGGKSKGVSRKILWQAVTEMFTMSREIKKYKKLLKQKQITVA